MLQKNDTFAAIAARRVTYRQENLVEPGPQDLPDRMLPLSGPGEGGFEPFMENHAPEILRTRVSIPLTESDRRVQTTSIHRRELSYDCDGCVNLVEDRPILLRRNYVVSLKTTVLPRIDRLLQPVETLSQD